MNITPHFRPVGKSRSWQMASMLTAQNSRSTGEQDTFLSTSESKPNPGYQSRDFFTLGRDLRALALGGKSVTQS